MRTRKKTRPISSDELDALANSRMEGVQKEPYTLTPPKGWGELTDDQLRYVFTLLTMGKSVEEVATYCLVRFTGMEVVSRYSERYWMLRHGKESFMVDALDMAECIEDMLWIAEAPDMPVRIAEVDGHKAVDSQLHGITFGDYIRLENYYQGYLISHDDRAVDAMVGILYPGLETSHLDPCVRYGTVLWMVSVKKLFARLFPDFLRPASPNADGTPPDMRAVMVAEIRALTGGDVTKNAAVLESDAWDALTELNEKAREAREFNEKMKK